MRRACLFFSSAPTATRLGSGAGEGAAGQAGPRCALVGLMRRLGTKARKTVSLAAVWLFVMLLAWGAGGALWSPLFGLGSIPVAQALPPSAGERGAGWLGSSAATIDQQTPVLVGAGDIATCMLLHDDHTADLLDSIPGTVFTTGDNVAPDSTYALLTDCYGPTWGRHLARTRPAAGNHEYHVDGAVDYFDYFGAAAGEPGKGYYSYNIEGWHIIVLNSECANVGGCTTSSPQGQWLQADLAANPRSCTLAYWHRPLFSSGATHGGETTMRSFWQLLYNAGAEIVLNGHEHNYERFALQDPYGAAAPGRGIRQFSVGTGGGGLTDFGTIQPNSEVRNSDTHGVLKLTLYRTSYEWEFVPVAGETFTDSGSGNCVRILDTPVAADDTRAVAAGGTLNEPAPGLLSNDIDPENDPLAVTVTPVTPPVNGTLTLQADGSYTYVHDGSDTVTDSFVYQVCDPGPQCATATVALTVVPVNQLPVAGDDAYTAAEDTALQVPSALGVLVNDMVPDGDPLSAVLNTGPMHGILDLSPDGSFSYTPTGHFIGLDSFTYRANDGTIGSNLATVQIRVYARVYLPLTLRNW